MLYELIGTPMTQIEIIFSDEITISKEFNRYRKLSECRYQQLRLQCVETYRLYQPIVYCNANATSPF